jgi:ABC-type lipoprotein release transport system permease subunit
MLLSRATAREREISVRAASGATRCQILRQLLVESSILSLGGGMDGWRGVGLRGNQGAFLPHAAYHIPVETEIKIRIPVLLFTLASAVVTALLFGVAPALHSSRRDLARGLSGAGKGEGSGLRHGSLRNLLVVEEVGLSLVYWWGRALSCGACSRSWI